MFLLLKQKWRQARENMDTFRIELAITCSRYPTRVLNCLGQVLWKRDWTLSTLHFPILKRSHKAESWFSFVLYVTVIFIWMRALGDYIIFGLIGWALSGIPVWVPVTFSPFSAKHHLVLSLFSINNTTHCSNFAPGINLQYFLFSFFLFLWGRGRGGGLGAHFVLVTY